MFQRLFDQLDQQLCQHQTLWQQRPFTNTSTDTYKELPGLHTALLKLSEHEVEQLANDNDALLTWFEPWLPHTCQQFKNSQIMAHNTRQCQLDPSLATGVPGRKWQQMRSFIAAMPTPRHTIIDWCAGKGHLGRCLHQHFDRTVIGLELDTALCQAGNKLAAKHHSNVTLVPHNVLEPMPATLNTQAHSSIALHACGALHQQVIRQASQHRHADITLSPCCYHKIPDPQYRPMSRYAATANLQLSREAMHLVQEETVTAEGRVRALRRKEQIWRLAFDELQRAVTGNNHYLPLPSVGKQIFGGSFSQFCYWAGECKHLPLPNHIDEQHWLAMGEQRRQQVIRLDLTRQLFRRPLELWLVLDRVLFLEEQGYQVTLQTFCPRQLTPRNIMIHARLG